MKSFPSTTPPVTGTRRAGPLGLVGALGAGVALMGAAHAVLLIVYPPAVSEASYSFPFRPSAFAVSQSVLAVRDLGLAILIASLLWTSAARSKVGRAGLVVGAISMLVLAGLEVVSIVAGDSADLGGWYGLASFGVGLALTVSGVSAARRPLESPWLRFLPLVIGIYVFAVLTPGILAGFTAGQLVIGAWMLLFARLGQTLRHTATSPSRGSMPHLVTAR